MAGGAQESDDAITGINVTPLVDIFLVVLIIFMVTANFIANRSIPLDLPHGATGTDQVQSVFSVVLGKDGVMQVDSTTVPDERAIFLAAQAARKGNPELRAVLKVDVTVPYGRLHQVLDLLRQAQVTKIAFANQPGPAQPGTTLPTPPGGATP